MTLTVTHAYTAIGADDPEAEINRAEWNAEHVVVGAATVLPDPGETWQALTAYTAGDRITVADLVDTGLTEVFEATTGTSGASEPTWDIVAPLQVTADGSVDWTWLGRLGTVGFADISLDPQAATALDLVTPLRGDIGTRDGNNAANAADGDVWTANGDGTASFQTPGGLQSATVTLSSADILDLHNTPVELVAAPGAGKWLAVSHVAVSSTGTTPYTTTDNWPRVAYADGGASVLSATMVDALQNPGVSCVLPSSGATFTTPENLPLLITDNGESVLSDGDGTLTVTVWYSIEDVPA